MEDERRNVQLLLTREQLDVISALFGHYNWNFEDATVNNSCETSEDSSEVLTDRITDNRIFETTCVGNITSSSAGGNSGNTGGDQNDLADVLDGDCPNCLCNPCITHIQLWLGNGAPPHDRNSGLRNIRYRKFWTLLSQKGAWLDPRYKVRAMRQFQRTEADGCVCTKRKIMPDCVIVLVRQLYPNPESKLYMGHRWV